MARFNIPPLTRSVLILLVTLTLLNWTIRPDRTKISAPLTRVGGGAQILSIIPVSSIKYPWVCLTATLVEQNVWGLIVTGLTVFYGGRYLERAWASAEYAKFLLFVSMIPNLLSWILYILFYTLSRKESVLHTTISGGVAIQAGFLVSFKQLVPEHTVSILRGALRMRVKHFPALFLLANTISGLLFGTDTGLLLAWSGFFTSWLYLRFYRSTPSLSTAATGEGSFVRGDASDTFAFSFFFPEPLHTPIAQIGDRLYDLLLTLRVCTPFSAEAVDAGNEQATARAEGGLPSIMNSRGGRGGGGSSRAEAERRRALALKALDQRLHAAASSRGQPSTVSIPAPAAVAPARPIAATELKVEASHGEQREA